MDNLDEALREGLDSVGLVYIDENKDMPRCLLVASLTSKMVSFHGAISILATTIRKKEQSATVLFDKNVLKREREQLENRIKEIDELLARKNEA